MRSFKGILVFSLMVFFVSSFFSGLPGQREPVVAISTTIKGLHIADFKTPYGLISIGLPDDMTKGDVISVRLSLKPYGKTEKVIGKNLETLKKYLIEMNGQITKAAEDWGKWKIPDVKELPIILQSSDGKTLANLKLPVSSRPKPIFSPVSGETGDSMCPKVGLAGTVFQIKGQFDGDFANTAVLAGDVELKRWAESPRQVIVDSPKDILGKIPLTIKEGDYTGKCQFRNLSIMGVPEKDRLLKGETTIITVTVWGLEGLDETIPLNIENTTPNIISMKSEGTFFIEPQDVLPGGIFKTTRPLTGIEPGKFLILTSVAAGLAYSKECKHCTWRYTDLKILSDDCQKVEFKIASQHCENGEWGNKVPFESKVDKVPPFPRNPRKCTMVIHYHQSKKYAEYTLYHFNGKKWVWKTGTNVKKVAKLPKKAKDGQSTIVKKGRKHTFYHRKSGKWVKKGSWKEKKARER